MTLAVQYFYLTIYGTVLSFVTYFDKNLAARASEAAAVTFRAHRFCQL